MSHLLKILSLGLGASETEIKVHYRQLACKYHPDKNDYIATGLTMEEVTEFFKLLNNANDYRMDGAPLCKDLSAKPQKSHKCMLSCLQETRNKKQ